MYCVCVQHVCMHLQLQSVAPSVQETLALSRQHSATAAQLDASSERLVQPTAQLTAQPPLRERTKREVPPPVVWEQAALPILRDLGCDFDAADVTEESLSTALTRLAIDNPRDLAPEPLAAHLAPVLGKLVALRTLSFGRDVLRATLGHLSPALASLTSLRALEIDSNRLGADGAATLAAALLPLTRLTTLSLFNNSIGAAGAESLAPALQQLRDLQALGIFSNDIGAAGTAALAPALLHLTRLTALALDANDLGADGAECLAPSLLHLCDLEVLMLSGNDIGLAGADAIAPALERMSFLTVLVLSSNQLGNEGATVIAAAACGLPSLTIACFNNGLAPGMELALVRRTPFCARGSFCDFTPTTTQ
jgi:hypothetical protein